MAIYTVFFSPTGNTKKSVNTMAAAIAQHCGKNAADVSAYDCTVKTDAVLLENVEFETEDFVIIGAPVYAGRIPLAAKERLQQFRGKNTPCIIVASYGNRHYDDALLEMKDMAEANGFAVKGAAAVIGRHTYGEIQVDRPNAQDLKEMEAFAVNAYRSEHNLEKVPGNPVYREGIKGGKFKPSTLDTCIKCGLCKRNCPVGAIRDDFTVIEETCISCFRCIRNCPVKAKQMVSEEYDTFAAEFTSRLSQRRENEFFG